MGTREKALNRLASLPKDYTFAEAKSLMAKLGFEMLNKGKTSGSRVRFYRPSDGAATDLHKPHPLDEMKPYAVRQLRDYLIEIGEL